MKIRESELKKCLLLSDLMVFRSTIPDDVAEAEAVAVAIRGRSVDLNPRSSSGNAFKLKRSHRI